MTEPLKPVDELAQLLDSGNPPIDLCLLLLSQSLQDSPEIVETGLGYLDELADDVAARATQAPAVADLVHTLFVQHSFAGDVENYHGEENSMLDRVLARRIGMPITLSAVVACVGIRVGIPMSLIGLPGHVVVGAVDDDGNIATLVDAFAGAEVDTAALSQRLASIFRREVAVSDSMLVQMSTRSIVSRVCNNLTHTYSTDPLKLNRLIDVRAALVSSDQDRVSLAHLAEAQGRFDVAARLREQANPDDPVIDQLWGRLN